MPTVKDEIRDILNELPDDISFEDAVYQMYIPTKFDRTAGSAAVSRLVRPLPR